MTYPHAAEIITPTKLINGGVRLFDRQRRFRFHMRNWAHKWRTSGSDQLVRDYTLLNAIHCRRLAQNETTVGFHGL